MFDALTDKFNSLFRSLSGRGRITEANISDAMREVRKALLDADVSYQVAETFCKDVTKAAMGAEVINSLHPGQMMVKVVSDELTKLMGPVDSTIYYVSPGPTVILLAGLQGGGKTTTAGKLARYIQAQGKRPLLVADDLQRPAAVQQLQVLGEQVGVDVYTEETKDPVRVAKGALKHAKKNGHDVVILDTAGRLHIDEEMMAEIERVAKAVTPHQIYLVCDAMMGQDAVNSAKAFNERLELDGIILTKLDGDARGGAALSVKAVTGKPIKFVGMGEKLDKLEAFHPDRMASRILGMGDVVTLVEKAQETIDQSEALELQRKIKREEFSLQDFLDQMKKVKKMGSLTSIIKMIPGMNAAAKDMEIDDDAFKPMEAIINSMTPKERGNVDMINGVRRKRIAKGSGTNPADVNSLLKEFRQMRKLMSQMMRGGLGARGGALAHAGAGAGAGGFNHGSGALGSKMKPKHRRKRKTRKNTKRR